MPDPDQAEDAAVTPPARTRTLLAWASWLVSFGCCAAGLVVTLLVVRPV